MKIMKFCCLPKGLAPQWSKYILQDGLTTFAFHECASGGYSIKSTTRRQTLPLARNFNFLATKSWLMVAWTIMLHTIRGFAVLSIFFLKLVRRIRTHFVCTDALLSEHDSNVFFSFFFIRNAISSTRLSKHPQIHFCYRVASLITK